MGLTCLLTGVGDGRIRGGNSMWMGQKGARHVCRTEESFREDHRPVCEARIRGNLHDGEKWMNAYTSLSQTSLGNAWLFLLFQISIF